MKNRIAGVMATILAVCLLGGAVPMGVRLKPYWIAKYGGGGADLHGAYLVFAPLAGANLDFADLTDANLRGANLAGVSLGLADLSGADLTGANMSAAALTGAFYDATTRWPVGFDPRRHGAILK